MRGTDRIASEFYLNASNVMRGAAGVDADGGLSEQEVITEYWLLEQVKLQRLPKPKSLSGRVALVTGQARLREGGADGCDGGQGRSGWPARMRRRART